MTDLGQVSGKIIIPKTHDYAIREITKVAIGIVLAPKPQKHLFLAEEKLADAFLMTFEKCSKIDLNRQLFDEILPNRYSIIEKGG